MSTITINPPMPEVRPAFVAWSTAAGLGLVLIGAGLMSSTPLPLFGWAAAFLFFAVASDLRFHRIPNLLTALWEDYPSMRRAAKAGHVLRGQIILVSERGPQPGFPG